MGFQVLDRSGTVRLFRHLEDPTEYNPPNTPLRLTRRISGTYPTARHGQGVHKLSISLKPINTANEVKHQVAHYSYSFPARKRCHFIFMSINMRVLH